MSLPNVNADGANAASAAAGTDAKKSTAGSKIAQQLGADAFLKLLTTQLANQDPMNPMDDTQSIAQLAQFSQLQATTNLSDSFSKYQAQTSILSSASLLGKSVVMNDTSGSTDGSGSQVSGKIGTVQIADGVPKFTIVDGNGKIYADTDGNAVQFDSTQILKING